MPKRKHIGKGKQMTREQWEERSQLDKKSQKGWKEAITHVKRQKNPKNRGSWLMGEGASKELMKDMGWSDD